jgi:hypothetical protein
MKPTYFSPKKRVACDQAFLRRETAGRPPVQSKHPITLAKSRSIQP